MVRALSDDIGLLETDIPPYVGDQDWNPLVCGIKLVTDWSLLRRDTGVMGGKIAAVQIVLPLRM